MKGSRAAAAAAAEAATAPPVVSESFASSPPAKKSHKSRTKKSKKRSQEGEITPAVVLTKNVSNRPVISGTVGVSKNLLWMGRLDAATSTSGLVELMERSRKNGVTVADASTATAPTADASTSTDAPANVHKKNAIHDVTTSNDCADTSAASAIPTTAGASIAIQTTADDCTAIPTTTDASTAIPTTADACTAIPTTDASYNVPVIDALKKVADATTSTSQISQGSQTRAATEVEKTTEDKTTDTDGLVSNQPTSVRADGPEKSLPPSFKPQGMLKFITSQNGKENKRPSSPDLPPPPPSPPNIPNSSHGPSLDPNLPLPSPPPSPPPPMIPPKKHRESKVLTSVELSKQHNVEVSEPPSPPRQTKIDHTYQIPKEVNQDKSKNSREETQDKPEIRREKSPRNSKAIQHIYQVPQEIPKGSSKGDNQPKETSPPVESPQEYTPKNARSQSKQRAQTSGPFQLFRNQSPTHEKWLPAARITKRKPVKITSFPANIPHQLLDGDQTRSRPPRKSDSPKRQKLERTG